MNDPHPEPEAELVRACAEGDADAWVRFVDRFGGLIATLARRMLDRRTGRSAETDVDEIAAGVFLALLKGDRRLLRRYRAEFRVSTYLGVICRTEVSRHLRGAGRRTVLLGDDLDGRGIADPGASTPLALLLQQERDAAVLSLRAALDELAPRDRLILTLKYLDGLDYGRIADVLRVERDSVGQLLHRAKARLAKRVPNLARWVDEGVDRS